MCETERERIDFHDAIIKKMCYKKHSYLPMLTYIVFMLFIFITAAVDLQKVTNELGSVVDKWFQIGVQLGVSESKLREIEADHHTAQRRFSMVISFWIRGNTHVPVTWKLLIQVLESSFVNEQGLANELREKCGMEVIESSPSTGLSFDNFCNISFDINLFYYFFSDANVSVVRGDSSVAIHCGESSEGKFILYT